MPSSPTPASSITASTAATHHAPKHAHHHAEDDTPPQQGAGGLKGVFMPVAIVLVIGTIFVSVYLAAFHSPKPHQLPVAVVGSAKQYGLVVAGLEQGLPDGFSVKQYTDESSARAAVEDRTVYAAYIPAGAHKAELLYAGANGPSVTSTVTGAFSAVAEAGSAKLAPKDIAPASAGDTRSMSVFYAAFGVVLAGFLFGMMTYQIAPRLQYRWRMASLASFSILGGLVVALLTGSVGFGALPGSYVGIAAVIAMMAAAVGGATMVFMRLFGPAGMSLASVVLLIFGNSTSGGVLPTAYLPGWLHPLSEILPVGVGVRAVQGLAHFHNDGLTSGIVILAVWIVLCAGIIYWRDIHAPRRQAAAAISAAG